ncbi:hypothetical protein ABKV19_001357 [Rosa sericea]
MRVYWFGVPCGFVALLLVLFCSSGAEVVTIDVQEAKDLIKSGYGYMDVRTVEEFKRGYVDAEKIYNIPYMFNTPEGRVKNPDFLKEVASACSKEDHIVVGCQSGVRSLYAVADLQNVGYKHLSNMGGGYLAWTEKHFPVVKPEDVDQKKPEDDEQKKPELVELKKPEDVEQKKPEAEL